MASSSSLDPLFAVRGVLAFVAFTELTACVRSLHEGVAGRQSALFTLREDSLALSHCYGFLCLQTALVLTHLAVCPHYRPLVSLSASALCLRLAFLLSHALVFGTVALDQVLIFPLVSLTVALLSTLLVPAITAGDFWSWGEDENAELLRKMKFPKNKRSSKKDE